MKNKFISQGQQEKLGVHKMSGNILDPGVVKHTDEESRKHTEAVSLINNKINSLSLDDSDKKVIPTGFNLIIKPYKSNPYVGKIESMGGLLFAPTIGLDGIIRSEDSGESESLDQIPCGKVISVGPECKYCKVGDDVYHRPGAVPIPFNSLGYYAINEQNIICRIARE